MKDKESRILAAPHKWKIHVEVTDKATFLVYAEGPGDRIGVSPRIVCTIDEVRETVEDLRSKIVDLEVNINERASELARLE